METGLNVYPQTEADKQAIDKLNNCGYMAEWNDEFKCFFFEEREELYDELEATIALELGPNINYRVEGVW